MTKRGGKRDGSGRTPLPIEEKKVPKTIYITPTLQDDIEQYATGKNFSEKCIDLISSQISRRKRGLGASVSVSRMHSGKKGSIQSVYSAAR